MVLPLLLQFLDRWTAAMPPGLLCTLRQRLRGEVLCAGTIRASASIGIRLARGNHASELARAQAPAPAPALAFHGHVMLQLVHRCASPLSLQA